ncbi:MAG: GIY-YIG nuclease family protein [Bacteroidota bacterium]
MLVWTRVRIPPAPPTLPEASREGELFFFNLLLFLFHRASVDPSTGLYGLFEMTWTVYILKCSDGQYYTGFTNNLQRRLKEHQEGKSFSTSYRLPFEVVTYVVFTDRQKAYAFEKYLKSGSGIAFRNKRLI